MDPKLKIFLAVLVAVLVLLPVTAKLLSSRSAGTMETASQTPSPAADSSELTAMAQNVVASLARGDTTAVAAKFDATMKAALPEAKLTEVWNSLTAQAGAFKQQLGTRQQKIQGFDVVFVTCAFERAKFDMQVAFNGNKEISGLYVKPPSM